MENAAIICSPGAVLYAEKLLLVVRANYIDRKMAPLGNGSCWTKFL